MNMLLSVVLMLLMMMMTVIVSECSSYLRSFFFCLGCFLLLGGDGVGDIINEGNSN